MDGILFLPPVFQPPWETTTRSQPAACHQSSHSRIAAWHEPGIGQTQPAGSTTCHTRGASDTITNPNGPTFPQPRKCRNQADRSTATTSSNPACAKSRSGTACQPNQTFRQRYTAHRRNCRCCIRHSPNLQIKTPGTTKQP